MTVGDFLQIMRASWKLSVYDTFTTIHPVLWVIYLVIPSLFGMFFFAMISLSAGADPGFVIIGNAVQSIALVTVYAVAGIPSTQKHVGTMQSICMTPAGLFTIFIGMSLFSIVAGLVSVTVSLASAAFIFGVNMSSINILSAVVVILLTALTMGGVSMIIGSIGIYMRTSAIIANVMTYVGLVLCGINFPVSQLPEWAQMISACYPLTYAVEAVRGAVAGMSIAELMFPISMMMILGAIFMILSYFLFRFFEKISKKLGRMDVF